jgi:hypothetical protein
MGCENDLLKGTRSEWYGNNEEILTISKTIKDKQADDDSLF